MAEKAEAGALESETDRRTAKKQMKAGQTDNIQAILPIPRYREDDVAPRRRTR